VTTKSREDGAALQRQMLGSSPPFSGSTNAPAFISDFIQEHIFGELWQRDAIDLKTRSLCTIAAIVATGALEDPLKNHVRGALANGASGEEILEVIVHTVIYSGLPLVTVAMRAAQEVLNEVKDKA
jgi:4-carboxymuconolactone decarboxylase